MVRCEVDYTVKPAQFGFLAPLERHGVSTFERLKQSWTICLCLRRRDANQLSGHLDIFLHVVPRSVPIKTMQSPLWTKPQNYKGRFPRKT
jgi:hypothetical protein